MSKVLAKSKPKPLPWIPPGKGMPQHKKHPKPIVKSKNNDPVSREVCTEISPQWDAVDVPKEGANKEVDTDMMSLSSHSSYEFERLKLENELDIHQISLLQEMKSLYVHFASLKTSYLSAHRLIDAQDIQDSTVKELFTEAGSLMRRLNSLFDDLEYAVSVLENTLNDNQKKVEFSKVLGIKEKLLVTLLTMYEKVIILFQIVLEKQDFKELSRNQEALKEKLKITERKCLSQEAVITDLERRLSIHQSKTATIESYKSNLESTKMELEKQLQHKEAQIKYLHTELMNSSEKYSKSDREDFIEIIEEIKTKAHNEKSALKKALKFSKTQSKEKEETYKKLLDEADEKEKMMYNLAAQRDQLKVQLTVNNNNIIQLKHQIEEMKLQNLKLQNEMTEIDSSHKKEVSHLKCAIEEKSTELDKTLKKKKRLEETVAELENELKQSNVYLRALKDEANSPKQLDVHTSKENSVHREIPRLVTLLQSTRETFEKLIHSSHLITASGDHMTENAGFGYCQEEILAAISEIKKHILELKKQLLPFLHDHEDVTEPSSSLKKNDLEKQLKKMEHLYRTTAKENESLRRKLEDPRNSSLATSTVQNNRNKFSEDTSSENLAKKFQLELYKKESEIASLKFELAQKEKDLDHQLRESKEKLRTLEIDSARMPSLEEELKNTRLELAFIQRKEEEETASLLQRAQELQESLDKKTDDCRNLEQYIQLIRASYFKVFDNS